MSTWKNSVQTFPDLDNLNAGKVFTSVTPITPEIFNEVVYALIFIFNFTQGGDV